MIAVPSRPADRPRRATSRPTAAALDVRPVTPDRWRELAEFFGPSGAYSGCWCMWWRLPGSEFSAGARDGAAGNKAAMRGLVRSGDVPGLIGYDERRPVGWVSVGPRPSYGRLLRSPTLKPGPDEDPDDPSVWSVVCFWIPRVHRGRGVAAALLDAAVAHAQDHGAQAVEAYPVDTSGARRPSADLFTGALEMYERAGFREVLRRKPTRPVVRR
jgi:ribosomal protein S18 acetylase RimI-like enzyme